MPALRLEFADDWQSPVIIVKHCADHQPEVLKKGAVQERYSTVMVLRRLS